MSRIFLLPLVLLASAWSFPALDAERRAHCYGWLSPSMEPHWARLFECTDIYHDAKNVMSEWVRLDPQRAGKAFSFLLCLSILANILQAVL
jgi:hypothetical protein